ncbi:uncharacterized protein EV422DRAFT_513346 [Fimicolochytrium jonesii]|uniref:uncharacterized protein n=1 Tax=Fimicolochytrium jonesii TaxID=1396493 RepID=UPI0022FE2623|nr:uncharacterized protein EV422DRAFT_513346 [Fimicolochytrium jonesii]KAI8825564.1 hypothetical protein EV422DRAFT_513346 [Fimicolochytrium jonesii]
MESSSKVSLKEGPNIGELAQESSHRNKGTWVPAIPLTLLAPVLIGLALLGVLLPNTIILTNASNETAALVTEKYFTSVISDVTFRCKAPISALLPIVQIATTIPDLADMFAAPTWRAFQTARGAPEQLAILREKNGIDVLVCSGARYRSGCNNANTPILNDTCVIRGMMQSIEHPATHKGAIAVVDDDPPISNFAMRGYTLDPTTRKVMNPAENDTFPFTDYSPVMIMMLNKSIVVPQPFFFINKVTGLGLKTAYTILVRMDSVTGLPSYGCGAGVNVDNSWITMLQKIKPMEQSIVALLELQDLFRATNFSVLSSSEMITAGVTFDASGNPKYGTAAVDERTAKLRLEVMQKFPTIAAATAAAAQQASFEIDLDNKRFITTLGMAQLAFNYKVLVVVTLPRDEIYGKIDAARTKSSTTSIGISIGVTLAIAGIFVVAVLPLFSLAKQMEGLTKLDFGTLESSGALDARSWVWELRKVQIVFGTMVKAFAGAIKKNKAMMGKQSGTSGTTSKHGQGNASDQKKAPPLRTADNV